MSAASLGFFGSIGDNAGVSFGVIAESVSVRADEVAGEEAGLTDVIVDVDCEAESDAVETDNDGEGANGAPSAVAATNDALEESVEGVTLMTPSLLEVEYGGGWTICRL